VTTHAAIKEHCGEDKDLVKYEKMKGALRLRLQQEKNELRKPNSLLNDRQRMATVDKSKL